MKEDEILIVVHKSLQPDGTFGLSVTWTGMTEDEMEEKLADLAEFEGNWPTDPNEITELGRG
jgi:hypothetical protein